MGISGLALKAHSIFSGLSNTDLQRIATATEVRQFHPGEYLIREAQDNPYLYLIQQGTASVRSYQVEFARIGPGCMAGEVSAAGISLPIADVIAMDRVSTLVIDAELVRSLAENDQSFRQNIRDTAMRRVLG